MDHNNDQKDQGSCYVEEPKSNNDQNPGQDPNKDQRPGNEDEIIRRVYIRIEPNTVMITASMVLGVLTVATAILGTVYLPFMLGGVAIIMGILSRDESGRPDFKAKIGIMLGALGIVLNIVVVATSVYTVFNNPEQYEAFDSVFERVYGEDFATFMQENGISVTIPE